MEKILLAPMRGYVVSSEENPIVGTNCLATCTGVLFYDDLNGKAAVCHIAPTDNVEEIKSLLVDMYVDVVSLKSFSKLKYFIIPGYYNDNYGVRRIIDDILQDDMFTKIETDSSYYETISIKGLDSYNQFAFDTIKGKFVKISDFEQTPMFYI